MKPATATRSPTAAGVRRVVLSFTWTATTCVPPPGLRAARDPLGIEQYQPQPSPHGHARAPEGGLCDPAGLLCRSAGYPLRPQDPRDDGGRQRLQLVPERGAGRTLEQRSPEVRAAPGTGPRLRGRAHGRAGEIG